MRLLRRTGVSAVAASVALAVAAGAGAVPNEDFTPGDVVVGGAGVVWLRNGVVVKTIEPPSFGVRALAFTVAPVTGVLHVAKSQPAVRYYNRQGVFLGGTYSPDTEADRVTAVARGPDGKIYVSVSTGRFLHRFVALTQDPATGRVKTEFSYLIFSEITDIEIAADGCTLFYSNLAGRVSRLDVCKDTSAAPLVRDIEPPRAIRLLPDATMLLALAGEIRRIDGNANTVRTYTAPGASGWTGVDLASDGTSFWALTEGGGLYRFDLASGGIIQGPIGVPAPAADLAVHGSPFGTAPAEVPAPPSASLDLDGVSTLTGQVLSGFVPPSETLQNPNMGGATCNPSGVSTIGVRADGDAFGPYRGTVKAAKAAAAVGPQTLGEFSGPLGLPPGPVRSLRGEFTLTGSGGTVKVAFAATRTGPPNTGVCSTFTRRTFPNSFVFTPDYALTGYYWNIRAGALAYQAEITKSGKTGTYSDKGNTSLFASGFFLRGPNNESAGSGGRWVQQFESTEVGVTEVFAKTGATVDHSAGVPDNTQSIILKTTWQSPKDEFSLTDIKIVKRGRAVGAGSRLAVTFAKGKTSVTATIKGAGAGDRVKFKVKAKKVGKKTKGKTTVRVVHGHRGRRLAPLLSAFARELQLRAP